jgi:adenosylhomocysteine nucleosidase
VKRRLPSVRPVSQGGLIGVESKGLSSHVLLVQTGIGPDKARLIAQQILGAGSWDVVVSSGFAGGLHSSCPIGSLVIGSEVVWASSAGWLIETERHRIPCHPDWVTRALNVPVIGPNPLRSGKFVTLDRVLTRAAQKQILAIQTGAVAVDMESGAIGQVARKHGVPFLIVRAISDGIHEDLPIDFNVLLRTPGWVGGVKQVLCAARGWREFWRLYRDSKRAGLQLSMFFERFFATVP